MLPLLAASCVMLPADMPAIVPRPASMVVKQGWFAVDDSTVIVAAGDAESTGRQLQSWLAPSTGLPMKLASSGRGSVIELKLTDDSSLGVEGYKLNVTPSRVTLVASDTPGLFYGCQTLRQLLPADAFRRGAVGLPSLQLPALEIVDKPRFKWRGLMLDTARHFIPKSDVLEFIDVMALHKQNVMHFHLTDDQGWRIEIKKYPRLTEVGSVRKQTVIGRNTGQFDGIPHGGFYTQEDLREIVSYAADRHITVVPEIDMPGHMVAAISAYPQLGDGKPAEVMQTWGVSSRVLNTSPLAVQFCKDVLTEVMDIFPSRFIHVGGDECPKDQWKNDPAEQERMKQRGCADEHELQSWFIRQMDTFLVQNKRRLIGWDEILEGGLADNAAVMSWRGTAGGIQAAQQGHDVVMTPTSHMYLDYYQSRSSAEPLSIGGYVPLQRVYSFEPVPTELEPSQAKHILGVQGNLWAEYIPNARHLMYMAYPRGCAVAELGWSPLEGKDFTDFANRLNRHLPRLGAMDVNYRPMRPSDFPVAYWKSGSTTETYAVQEWDISTVVQGRGDYRAMFIFTGGEHRLDIEWAELVVDGGTPIRDTHAGKAGGVTERNEYMFKGVVAKAGSKVILRASVRSDGGNDSAGEIFVERG